MHLFTFETRAILSTIMLLLLLTVSYMLVLMCDAHFCPHHHFMNKHICDTCTDSYRAMIHTLHWPGTTNTVLARMPQSQQAPWYPGGYHSDAQARGYTCVSDICVSYLWQCTTTSHCQLVMSHVRCLAAHIERNGHIVLASLASCQPIQFHDPLCGAATHNSTVCCGYGMATTWLVSSSYVVFSNVIPPF